MYIYLACCLTSQWRTHRSRVGSWDAHVRKIGNIGFTTSLDPPGSPRGVCQKKGLRGSTVRLKTIRGGRREGSVSQLTHFPSEQIFSVPIYWRFVSQMPWVRMRMKIHISMEAPGLLVTVSTVTVTMALSRVLERCQSLHPMTKALITVVNQNVT